MEEREIKFLRGTKEQNDAYIGESGTLTIDQTTMEIRLHDGVTPGGFRLVNIGTIRDLKEAQN
jgi:hypothetical protein